MPVSKLIFATSAKCKDDDNKWSVYKQNYILNTYWTTTTTAVGGVRSCPSGYPTAPGIKMTATEAVFATFELLEAILHSLPPLDLLLSVAVCRPWHQTILNSTPLQRRLFFAPAPADTTRVQNPIPTAKFWPILHGFGCTDDFAEQLRAECWGPCFYDHTRRLRYLISGQLPQSAVEGFSAASREAYFRPEASWRRMLAIQPPVDMFCVVQSRFSKNPWEEGWPKSVPRWLMRIQHHMWAGMVAQVVPRPLRAGLLWEDMVWNMWDRVGVTDKDEGSQRNESLDAIGGVHRVVYIDKSLCVDWWMDKNASYVDWWMDRNTSAKNNDREVEDIKL
ncbi:hypothetical protein V494_01624 [Pseudogymnoascus sp. VKM F-4513 (FW-928)]|nr:hypothetical protein V494_01624 [Pseudogymnoascus sp. VKM F-4513 (FW-928)]